MAHDFLTDFLGNVNRARILRVFVFNQTEAFTVAQIAKRAGVALALAEKEIKYFDKIELIRRGEFTITLGNGSDRAISAGGGKIKQRETVWSLNPLCKHIATVTRFVHEVSPAQHDVVLGALKSSGKIATVILSGVFMGDPSRPADLIVAADTINESRLDRAVKKLEPIFGREIRYAAFTTPEFRYRLTVQDRLMRDTLDFPHLVLFDRAGLLL